MENPATLVQPITPPPVQPPANHAKIAFLILIIIILSVSLTAIFFLKIYFLLAEVPSSPRNEGGPTSTPLPIITNTPIPTIIITPQPTLGAGSAVPSEVPSAARGEVEGQNPICDVPDNSLCRVISDLKNALTNKDYNGLLAYQNIQSTTCDPDGMFVTICEGEAKGVVKQGYSIGYNQSEGTVTTKADYLKTVSAYVNGNSPLNYKGTVFQNDKAAVVFLNPKKDHVLLFPLKRTGTSWTMDFILVGGTFGDNSFENLNNSLLDFVQ